MGMAVRYGSVSPTHKERFEPGSFTQSLARDTTRTPLWLDVQHEFNQVIAYTGAGLELRDSAAALEVVATLPRIPAADLALAAVKRGELRGFSIEFFPEAERREDGIRVIEKAHLQGLGLVADPSYTESLAEIRRRGGGGGGGGKRSWQARGKLPTKRRLRCECKNRAEGVDHVEFDKRAFDKMLKDQNITVVIGDYKQTVASQAKGSVSFAKSDTGLKFTIKDLPDTDAVADLIETAKVAPVIARPVFRGTPTKVVTDSDGLKVAHYDEVEVRAITLGSTDATEGWPEVSFTRVPSKREARSRLLLF